MFTNVLFSSDEFVDVEVEQEEKEEWAKPLTQLWQSRPFNPQAEWEYNKKMGQQAPYCSICLLFHTYHQVKARSILYFNDGSFISFYLLNQDIRTRHYSRNRRLVLFPPCSNWNRLLLKWCLKPYLHLWNLFLTFFKSESSNGSSSMTLMNKPGGRQWSKPLIPEMCFNTQSNKSNDSGEGQLSSPHVAEDGTSRLVSCSQCCVRVHTSELSFPNEWLYLKCLHW